MEATAEKAWYDPFGWFTGKAEPTTVPTAGNNPTGGINPVATNTDPSFLDFIMATLKGDEMAIESWQSGYEVSIVATAVDNIKEGAANIGSSIGSGLKTFLIWVLVFAIVGVFVFYFVKASASRMA